MTSTERAEKLRSLAESLSADEQERDRLKKRTDETLARLHDAVREFVRLRDLERPAAGTRSAHG
jgi:hypothetical protein